MIKITEISLAYPDFLIPSYFSPDKKVIVLGPPLSGKTTFCHFLTQFTSVSFEPTLFEAFQLSLRKEVKIQDAFWFLIQKMDITSHVLEGWKLQHALLNQNYFLFQEGLCDFENLEIFLLRPPREAFLQRLRENKNRFLRLERDFSLASIEAYYSTLEHFLRESRRFL